MFGTNENLEVLRKEIKSHSKETEDTKEKPWKRKN